VEKLVLANDQTLRSAAAFRELSLAERARPWAAEKARTEPGAPCAPAVCALAVAPERRDETTYRLYRPTRSAPAALWELSASTGTHFDPRVVPAFVEVLGGLRRETA
jgi:hypothetical protein